MCWSRKVSDSLSKVGIFIADRYTIIYIEMFFEHITFFKNIPSFFRTDIKVFFDA